MSLSPGTRIGKYTVRRKLAEGGMAEIFLCAAEGPGGFSKDVVIKRIRPFLSDDPAFVQMFVAEARLASRLEHPNIVQIFDFDRHDDTYYLAMEWVRGASLSDLRRRCREAGRAFPPLLAAHVAAQVARGLVYAHRLTVGGEPLNVVHRDVTPHNVLLSFEGAVKLGDFGIAHAGQASTAPGIKGKFAYMSPEQARGEPVDGRCDVFALGVVLWELLTGGRPFEAESDMAVLRAVQQRVITPPHRLNPGVSERLSAVVMRALERDLERRWSGALAMQHALEQIVLEERTDLVETDVGAFLRELFGEPTVEDPPAAPSPPIELSLSSLALEPRPSATASEPLPATAPGRAHGLHTASVTQPSTLSGVAADADLQVGPYALARRLGEGTPADAQAPTWLVARDGAQAPVLVRREAQAPAPPPRRVRRRWTALAIALVVGGLTGLALRNAAQEPAAATRDVGRVPDPQPRARGASSTPAEAGAPGRVTGPGGPLLSGASLFDFLSQPRASPGDLTVLDGRHRSDGERLGAQRELEALSLANPGGPGAGVLAPSEVETDPGDEELVEPEALEVAEPSTRKDPRVGARSAGTSKARSGLVVVDVFPSAELRVNGRVRGVVRGRHALRLPAGVHTLHFAHSNHSASHEVIVKSGATQQVKFNAFRPGN